MCFLGRKKDAGSSGPLSRRATLQATESAACVPKRSSPPISSVTSIHTEQPKDDAAIIRLFNLLDNSITDHVLNYYITSEDDQDSSSDERFSQFGSKHKKDLAWVMRAATATRNLKEAKMQVIVIRSIVGAEVFKAVRDGVFVPPISGMHQNPRRAESRGRNGQKNPPATTIDHKARFDFYHSLSRNPQYPAYREEAVASLTDAIIRLTLPLAADKDREDARQRSLGSIVNSAADFAVTIGKQRPAFRVSFPQLRSGSKNSNRKGENTDVPVLVPELRKYGDEKGLGYDRYIPLVPMQRLPDGL